MRYGKILSVVARENTEVDMTGKATGSGKENGANVDGKLKVKIGKQITGYHVDAIKAGLKPEDIEKIYE